MLKRETIPRHRRLIGVCTGETAIVLFVVDRLVGVVTLRVDTFAREFSQSRLYLLRVAETHLFTGLGHFWN